MAVKLINIGFGNIVSANRIIAIVGPEAAPIKRIVQDARDRGSLIVSDSGHVILSAVQSETISHRITSRDPLLTEVEEEEETES